MNSIPANLISLKELTMLSNEELGYPSLAQRELKDLIKECIRQASELPRGRNISMVITNLENAEDKLNRIIEGQQ